MTTALRNHLTERDAPAVIDVPTTGPVGVWELRKGFARRVGEAPDTTTAAKHLRLLSVGCIERGGKILRESPGLSRFQKARILAAINAARGGGPVAVADEPARQAEAPAQEEPAAAPVAVGEERQRAPRMRRVDTGLCPGCDQAPPTHLTVCPYAASVVPSQKASMLPTPADCRACGEPPPDHRAGCPLASPASAVDANGCEEDDEPEEDPTTYTRASSVEELDAREARAEERARSRELGPAATAPTDANPDTTTHDQEPPTMPTKTRKTPKPARAARPTTPPSDAPATRCAAKGCDADAASVTPRTRPELARFCAGDRKKSYERALHWGCTLAVAAQTVEEGTIERPEGTTPSRRGQRPGAEKSAPEPSPAGDCTRCGKHPQACITKRTPKGTETLCGHCRRIEAMSRNGTTTGRKAGKAPPKRPVGRPRKVPVAPPHRSEQRPSVDTVEDPTVVLVRELRALLATPHRSEQRPSVDTVEDPTVVLVRELRALLATPHRSEQRPSVDTVEDPTVVLVRELRALLATRPTEARVREIVVEEGLRLVRLAGSAS